ncbi:hypothetical protein TRFO_40229 [Tritrichomonas foetus]|uniref:Uncharacterized protein n=1 Tax=Tritrichomonas foetus TaxID=1144522 RepID=A0A1J4J5Q3_9EUKA|nr:hypothetical protein TRFO_40229 [Tritrichomonas foetus]|eukprot:OHS93479.1 hypothetical protein TRFO_40229 [Tritrichomonas foetus]
MIDDEPLQDIEISNFDEEESLISADLPLKQNLSFSFYIPFFLIIAGIVAYFVSPQKYIFSEKSEPLTTVDGSTIHHVQSKLSQISTFSKNLLVTFRFKNFESCKLFNGIFSITLLRDDMNVHYYNVSFKSSTLSNNSIDLLHANVLNFDTICITGDFYAKSDSTQILSLETRTGNQDYEMMVNVFRIVCSIFIAPNLLFFFTIFTGKFEKKITYFLSLFTLLYVNPYFLMFSLQPEQSQLSMHLIFRDLFFSYLVFYCFSIFSNFKNDNLNNFQNKSSFSSKLFKCVMSFFGWFVFIVVPSVSVFLYFISKDLTNHNLTEILLDRDIEKNLKFDQISGHHYFVFVIASFAIPIRILSSSFSSSSTKRSKSLNNPFSYYSLFTFLFLFFLIFYMMILYFTNYLNDNVAEDIIPMVIFTAYSLIMERGHDDCDENVVGIKNGEGYIDAQNDFDDLGLNPMGIDEDDKIK